MMPFQDHNRPLLHSFNGPVTSLTILSQKALVGCGNEVSVYCLNNLNLNTRQQVLHGACIHGFTQGSFHSDGRRLVCVYGAKRACVIAVNTNGSTDTDLSVVSDIAHFSDWIWESRWVTYEKTTSSVVFALAHNVVVLWDWKNNRIIQHQDCVEKCILYCAHFIGDSWDSLVLAAGTVFNQVVLWLASHNDDSGGKENKESSQCQKAVPVMHTFTGHKGVIFSIKYHAEHQRLCSVSDDRSIRMWQIDFPEGKTATPTAKDWMGMKSSLLLSVFGHSARVWGVVLMTDCFASVGEDATCCIWDYSGQIILKFKGHKGKSIWSIAVTEDEQHLVTGGGDGSVRKWRINTGRDNSPSHQALDVSKLLSVPEEDFPRTVTLLDYDRVLIMMNTGCLYSYAVGTQRFDCVFKDPRFTSYSIVSPCYDKQKIAVASIGGLIKILDLIPGKLQDAPAVEESLFNSKILGVVWTSSERLVVSGPQGVCHILKVTANENGALHMIKESSLFLPVGKHRWISAACFLDVHSGVSLKFLACGDKNGTIYSYQIPDETKAACHLIQPSQSFPKIHGKNGVTSLCSKDCVLYSVGRDGCCRHWEMEEGQLVLLHGSKVVKGFEWIDRLECSNGDLLFYGFVSTQFMIWSQSFNQKLFCTDCGGGHRSWGCFSDKGNDAYRFVYLKGGVVHLVDSVQCSRHEIIKPALHGREIHDVKLMPVPSKRCFHYPFFLTFTASEDTTINIGLYHYTNGFTQWKPLAALRGHLSSVRALALSHDPLKSSQLSTGVRDSNHLTDLDCSDRSFTQNTSDFILFTGGGRAEIRVWKVRVRNSDEDNLPLDVSGDNNGCLTNNEECVKSCDLKTGNESGCYYRNSLVNDDVRKEIEPISCTHQEWSTHYLGEARHKRPFSKWKTRKLRLDPETRVMSLDSIPVCDTFPPEFCDRTQSWDGGDQPKMDLENLHILSAAGSDGLLRVFCYNDQTRKLTPISQSAFHRGCVLKVLHFVFKSKHDNLFLAFSTSTNGNIAVWSMERVVTQAIDLEHKLSLSPQTAHSLEHDKSMDTKTLSHHEDCTFTFTHEDSNAIGKQKETDIETDSGGGGSNSNTTIDEKDKQELGGATSYNNKEDVDGDDDDTNDDQTEDFHPLCSLPAHQSGINVIHALQLNDTTFLLASGGDDNALTVQVLEVIGREVKVKCCTTNNKAHSAQITGLRLVSDSVMVSSSIDQRICVWGLERGGADHIKMAMLSSCYIYLADVSCMDVVLHRNAVYLCLGGEGLCLYSWNGDQMVERVTAN